MTIPQPSKGWLQKPAISPEQLRLWIARRERVRKRIKLVVVSILAVAVAGLAVGWTFFHRQLLAIGHLQSLGFMVDWDLNLENLPKGGATTVAFHPGYLNTPFSIKAHDLVELSALTHLKSLDLSLVEGMSDEDMGVIASLGELEDLQLNRTVAPYAGQIRTQRIRFTDLVLEHLKGLSRLKSLGLSDNRITDNGLAKLANLQSLESLDLDGTLVTDAGLAALKGLKGLKTLRVENTAVTREGVARFQQTRPDIEVIREPYSLSEAILNQ